MLTEKQVMLKKKLYSILDDRAFVATVGGSLATDDETDSMMEFIDKGEWSDPYETAIRALRIDQARQ